MAKRLHLHLTAMVLLLVTLANTAFGQLLSTNPDFVPEAGTGNIEITLDATRGNAGLKDYTPVTDVYVHIGAITTSSTSATDWKYVKFTWGTTNAAAACVSLGNNKWKYTITGGLRTFFGITNPSEKIQKIAILFRSGNGNKVQRNTDGSDMYLPVYETGLMVRIDEPFKQPLFVPAPEPITKSLGDQQNIVAKASSIANLRLLFNGTQVANASNATNISTTVNFSTAGQQVIIAEAVAGSTTVRDTLQFFIASSTVIEDLPAGVKEGLNYETGDTSVTLVLYAPSKNRIAVIGDFNNWTESSNYQMKRTPDGTKFWIRITGLSPGVEYAYQYLIDGTLKVADYNTEKILDPNNDSFIDNNTYPSLKPYPTGKTTGIVSVLQTRKPIYTWQINNFNKPNKKNLVIYELLVRDFVAAHNWNTLKDTLSYFKRLGINAIHVMPFNEFEGNLSWGYNPSFYFAPDKYYGTENALKAFIDECHKQGIAVIMDMVLNHSFGQSPMVQMYWDATNNKPATNSPWFNPDAKHPFNVGYDFNHESQATKNFVDRVMEHWLINYKIDGFRWDLSKGFTQVNSGSNVAQWGNYDASRVAIWKRIYDKMQQISSNSYCILEHFSDNTEEKELAEYGMLLWGNLNYNFNEATMGYVSTSNFDGAIHTKRNWNVPHLIAYMESHDEERLMYKNINFGNAANAAHNVKDVAVGLKRNEAAAAFWAIIPGPKLMWQFGELGYDFSINYCEDGTINNNCRTGNKPIKWDYYNNPNRKALFDVYSKLIKLKLTPNYEKTFADGTVGFALSGAVKTLTVSSDSLKVFVIGNFDVNAQTTTITFPNAGTWYNYLTGTTKTATGAAESITLQPGEYFVYTDRNTSGTVPTSINWIRNDLKANLKAFPNPVQTVSTIQFELLQSGNIQLQLLSNAGQIIQTIYTGFKSKGKHTMVVDMQNNSTGLYYIQLLQNGKSEWIKLMK